MGGQSVALETGNVPAYGIETEHEQLRQIPFPLKCSSIEIWTLKN